MTKLPEPLPATKHRQAYAKMGNIFDIMKTYVRSF
jgi:hypothetical protein